MGKKSKRRNKIEKRNRNNFRKKLKGANNLSKNTLSKDKRKKLFKSLEKVSEIKELREARLECKHTDKKQELLVAIGEIDRDYVHLVKNLDLFVETFGKENVRVCKDCLTAVPNRAVITEKRVDMAVATIAAMAEHSVMAMKDAKKVKKIHKVSYEALENAKEISKVYLKKYPDEVEVSSSSNYSNSDEIDYSNITQ